LGCSFLAEIWSESFGGAMTAYFAVVHVLTLAAGCFGVANEYFILAFRCILGWALMKHEPSTRKT